MPFNSNQNSYNSSYAPEESFKVLQNSYNIPKEGMTMIPQNQLQERVPINQQYLMPANLHSNYIYYNQDELKYINNHQRRHAPNKQDEEMDRLVGEGIGRLMKKITAHSKPPYTELPKTVRRRGASAKTEYHTLEGGNVFKKAAKGIKKATKTVKKETNKVVNKVEKESKPVLKKAEKVAIKAGKDLKNSAVNEDGVIHQIIEKANDYAIPFAGEALGTAVGTAASMYMGDPTGQSGGEIGGKIGKAAGQIARKQLNQKTGYGKVPGVGKYKKTVNLDKVINKYVPGLKGGSIVEMKAAVMPKRKLSQSISDRNTVVRNIMKEKGLSLPQASKFVKDNKLWEK